MARLQTLALAALLAVSACAAARASEFYGENSGVVNLDTKNFDAVAGRKGGVVLVEFYAPWCGHCKALTPEWIKAARALSGVATVAAVNADEAANRPLAGRFDVKGFPTIKAFVDGSRAPVDYNGARTAKAIAKFAKGLLPSRVTTLTARGAAKWHAKHADKPRVVLFSDKSAVSAVFKSLSVQLEGHAAVGQVHKREKALVKEFEVSRFPTLVVVRPGDENGAHVAFDGKMTPKAVARWVRRHVPGAPGGEDDYLPQLHDQSCLEKHCRGKTSLCALLVLPASMRDSPAMDAAMGARDSRSDSLFSFAWVDQEEQAGWLSSAFGVEPQDYAQLVVLAARKKRFAQHVGSVTDASGVNSFLDRVLRGAAKTRPLASGKDADVPPLAGDSAKCAPPKAKEEPKKQQKAKKQGGGGGGPAGPGSVELTEANFEELVLGSAQPWVVEFYAPWCGHCKALAPAWKQAAKRARGQARFGAVNCDDHPGLASKYGIKGFPTIKTFAAGRDAKAKKPRDYQGARSAEAIAKHALSLLPSDAVPVLEGHEAFQVWFAEGADTMRVLLLSEKDEPSRLVNALSLQFEGALKFAHVPASAGLGEAFGVDSYPSVLVLDRPSNADPEKGSVATQRYQGKMTYPAIAQFCDALAQAQAQAQAATGSVGEPVVSPAVTYATSQAEFDAGCTSRGGLCVVSFLRPSLLTGAAGGEPSDAENVLTALAAKNAKLPVHFVALDREAQAAFWEQFSLNADLDATLVVLSVKKGRYAALVSLYDEEHIQEFIDDVLASRVRTAKLRGGLKPLLDEAGAGEEAGEAPKAKEEL